MSPVRETDTFKNRIYDRNAATDIPHQLKDGENATRNIQQARTVHPATVAGERE
jgi:hypothetical protein